MTVKAVSRAVRRRKLIDAALNTILIADAPVPVPLPAKDTIEEPQVATADTETDDVVPQDTTSDAVTTDQTIASELYDRTMSSSLSVEVCSTEVLRKIQTEIENETEMMTMPTAKLWLQYLNMVDISYGNLLKLKE